MAVFKITSFDSIFANVGTGFFRNLAGANSLTVDESAYIVANSIDAAVILNSIGFGASTGPWSVTANGSIFSKDGPGLLVQTTSLTTVTVGVHGEIGSGTDTAIHVDRGPANIKNAGLISGGFGEDAVSLAGKSTITNSGMIVGDIFTSTGALTVANSGKIAGSITTQSSDDKVTNSRHIEGDINFGEGNNTYTATKGSLISNIFAGSGNDTVSVVGEILETVQLGGGNNKFTLGKESYFYDFDNGAFGFISGNGDDIFSNAGTIFANVTLGDGNNSFTNTGTVNGDVTSINGSATFTNSGTINGGVGFSFTTVTFKNTGTITGGITGGAFVDTFSNTKTIGGNVSLIDGNDVVTNSGTIEGTLDLGKGDDKLTNTGKISGGLELGDGNDTYVGGSLQDYVRDSNDSDNIKLGAGDDSYDAWQATLDGADTIDGGTGIDLYAAYGAAGVNGDIFINLDTVNHDTGILGGMAIPVSAKSATGADVGNDTITGFENVETGNGADVIFGNASANAINSSGGNDIVFGFGGNDQIFTGNGVDKLVGGAGADRMAGGNDVDHYIYLSVTDSGTTKATRDTLSNFIDTSDLIDLSRIDANTKNGAVNDPFVYINAMGEESAVFTKAAGQLRSYWTVAGQMIEGDVNGDGKADFSIFVDDIDHSIVFTKDDFIL
jgi:hypothetical protein